MYMEISKAAPETERILIISNIDETTTPDIILQIEKINDEDNQLEEAYSDYTRKEISIIIQTFGGCIYSGLGVIAAMRNSKTPITTYSYGMTMSMGFIIFLFGNKRVMDLYSTLMWHDMIISDYNKLESVKENVKESERLMEVLVKIVLEKTKIKKSDLTKILKCKQDWYINAEEAKNLGICDEIR